MTYRVQKTHSCTGTAPGILATRTWCFPTHGSLGDGTKRPLFDGSFLGNLGAFRELFGNLLLPLPFYWELVESPCLFGSFQKLPIRQRASTSSRPCGGKNHKKSVENQWND